MDVKFSDDIPEGAQKVIQLSIGILRLPTFTSDQDFADCFERVYRVGVAQGRVEGATMAGDIINRAAEKMAAKVEA